MIQRIARIARSRIAAIAMGLLLAVVGMAALPAAPASASSNVSAVFSGDSDYATPSCSAPGTYYYPGSALQVYNPCSTRVWVHYTSGSSVQAYCVNPGGAIAYDLPIHWASGDTSDLQITTNSSQCDSGTYWGINWFNNGFLAASQTNACQMDGNGNPFTEPGLYVGWVADGGCNFRIWLHQEDNGTGASYCINGKGDTPTFHNPLYYQVQETYNQAPCNAGGPPYPY